MPSLCVCRKFGLSLSLLLLCLHAAQWADAEALHLQLPAGVPANAEYRIGAADKPALLVLHGFLQTYDFLATMNIVNGLSALDYTVLAPNLSFAVPDRRQSVQCNAAHTHTFKQDLAEIDFWVQWLQAQGYTSIILVGHSWGSQHSLGYAAAQPGGPLKAIIAISLVRSHQSETLLARQIKLARQLRQAGDKSLHPYELSFCKEYMATPDSYLSYAQWDDRYLLDVLSRLQARKLPVHVILGGSDRRVDDAWIKAVEPRVSGLSVVEDANHFFSHMSEFELNDRLEEIMPKLNN